MGRMKLGRSSEIAEGKQCGLLTERKGHAGGGSAKNGTKMKEKEYRKKNVRKRMEEKECRVNKSMLYYTSVLIRSYSALLD